MAFDPDWPHGHVTVDGRKARIVSKEHKGRRGETIIAIVTNDICEEVKTYLPNGEWIKGPYDGCNLLNAPAPKRKFVRWVNMYERDGVVAFSYKNKRTADVAGEGENRIACIRVEFEEGDGLDD